MMKVCFFVLTGLMLVSCGKSPEFIAPADGQSVAVETFQRLDFQTKDQSTQITFIGTESIAEEIDCVSGSGIAYCQRKLVQGQGVGTGFSRLCQGGTQTQKRFTVTAVAGPDPKKGVDLRKVIFTCGTTAAAPR